MTSCMGRHNGQEMHGILNLDGAVGATRHKDVLAWRRGRECSEAACGRGCGCACACALQREMSKYGASGARYPGSGGGEQARQHRQQQQQQQREDAQRPPWRPRTKRETMDAMFARKESREQRAEKASGGHGGFVGPFRGAGLRPYCGSQGFLARPDWPAQPVAPTPRTCTHFQTISAARLGPHLLRSFVPPFCASCCQSSASSPSSLLFAPSLRRCSHVPTCPVTFGPPLLRPLIVVPFSWDKHCHGQTSHLHLPRNLIPQPAHPLLSRHRRACLVNSNPRRFEKPNSYHSERSTCGIVPDPPFERNQKHPPPIPAKRQVISARHDSRTNWTLH